MKTNVVTTVFNKARDALDARKRAQTFNTLRKATLLIERSLTSTPAEQVKTAERVRKMTERIPEATGDEHLDRARKLNQHKD